MKSLIYLFSIGLLLWVVFNPEGIITYQQEVTKLKTLNNQEEAKDNLLKIREQELEELKNYILSISDSPQLTIAPPPDLENIEKELILKGIIPKDKNILRWNKKKALLE